MGAQRVEVAQGKKETEIFSDDSSLKWLFSGLQIDGLEQDCPSNFHRRSDRGSMVITSAFFSVGVNTSRWSLIVRVTAPDCC